jgi:hypothetical protein
LHEKNKFEKKKNLSFRFGPTRTRPSPLRPAQSPSGPRSSVHRRDSTGVRCLPVFGVRAAHDTNSRAAPLFSRVPEPLCALARRPAPLLPCAAAGALAGQTRRRLDLLLGSAATEASRRRDKDTLIETPTYRPSAYPDARWSAAYGDRAAGAVGHLLLSDSDRLRRSPPVVSTSSRPPRSPLSILRLGRTLSTPDRRRFELLELPCPPWTEVGEAPAVLQLGPYLFQ